MTQIIEKLAACPFCGSHDLAIIPQYAEDDPKREMAKAVACRDCAAIGRHNFPIGWTESEREAIEAWNTRSYAALAESDLDKSPLSQAIYATRGEGWNSHREMIEVAIKAYLNSLAQLRKE